MATVRFGVRAGRSSPARAQHGTLGSNSVRYLIQWKSVEPAPSRYDDGYLDDAAEHVAWYREQGMHVIPDMHQDSLRPRRLQGLR
ncbi:cellulase family glycosylhydrolase [Actinomadura latina]|uniref:cellulase family glycosylhydrolase n=1 Tax=Actinomadura latina TaxID=163603 RepID=UPI0024800FC4|nr:cellulase family glycosylhydrolase [Actinomadura latina]